MKKIMLAALAIGFVFQVAYANAGLSIIGFNADNTDGFAVVATEDFASGTEFFFTDNAWDGRKFTTGEGIIKFELGQALTQGTILRFDGLNQRSAADMTVVDGSTSAFSGTFAVQSGGFNFDPDGDHLYAYTSSDSTGSIVNRQLSSLVNENGGATLFSNTDGAQIDLSSGSTLNADNLSYTGSQVASSFSEFAGLISDKNNWTVQGDGDTFSWSPPTGTFSISAVPEPSAFTYALIFGLTIFGPRRRK